MKAERKQSSWVSIIVLLAVCLLYTAIKYTIEKDSGIHLDQAVQDSGIYMTDEVFESEKDRVFHEGMGERHKGEHVRIICRISAKEQQKRKGYYWYFPVKDLRRERYYAVISEEPIPSGQYEIDGLISGEQKNGKGNYPILRVCGAEPNKQTRFEISAALVSAREPGLRTENGGLVLTLDRIEYRGVLAQVYFTVENRGEENAYLYHMDFKTRGVSRGGALVLRSYQPPLEIRKYLTGNEDKLPSGLLKPGQLDTAILALSPIDPEDPLDLRLEYLIMRDLENDEANEHIELRLICPP